ncbi:hypothetical protein [Bacillus sp. OV322]|nr:hypothetical protein [Bacillus sp. OV322]
MFMTAAICGSTITWAIHSINDTGDSFNTTITSAVTPQNFMVGCSQF